MTIEQRISDACLRAARHGIFNSRVHLDPVGHADLMQELRQRADLAATFAAKDDCPPSLRPLRGAAAVLIDKWNFGFGLMEIVSDCDVPFGQFALKP